MHVEVERQDFLQGGEYTLVEIRQQKQRESSLLQGLNKLISTKDITQTD